jgi:hypothetical protein
MTMPVYFDLKDIRNKRFDEQGGKCYYCGVQMLREMQYKPRQGQPWYLCTLEHLTDRLDPHRWDKNTDQSPQRYAAACARCNHARSAWNQKHTPPELIDLLSRNPERKRGRQIVTEYYETHEYVPPPPFDPGKCERLWVDSTPFNQPKAAQVEPVQLSVKERSVLLKKFVLG